jgi:hypothetical protein
VGDDADILALGLQDRALFDMQLEEGVHLAVADLLLAFPADALQFVAEALTLGVDPVIGPVARVLSGKDARGEHRGGVARPLLVGPVGDHDGMLRLDPEIVERADDLQPAEDAEDPVVFPARGLGVEMRAHVDRKRIGIRPLAAREHVAHLVDAHGHAGLGAPALEQVTPLAVLVGERLAVVAARDAGADPGHLHERVPQPLAIDLQVFAGCGHGRSFVVVLSVAAGRGNALGKGR